MNQYIINVWCDRLGVEVEETITPEPGKSIYSWRDSIFKWAIDQHQGQCGNRNNPCGAEAMRTGHSTIQTGIIRG
mgnify:CR=1 FL=1